MPSPKIDELLAKPIFLWIISLVIAVGLWFYVLDKEAETEKIKTVACKVEFVNLAPQLEVKNSEREVWVDIYGTESEIDRIDAASIICEADTRGLSAGRYRLSVRAVAPKGLRVRGVMPSQIDVELLRYADRLVPVEVALPKDLPEGTYLDLVEIVPKEISVKGTERDLARIGSAKISPTVEELQSGKELLLTPGIEKSDPFEEKVNIEPAQVRFKAVLVTGSPRRMVAVNARIIGKPDGDHAVQSTTIDPAEIMVEGPKALLDKLNSLETETIDISGISESKAMVVPVRAPQDKNLNIVGEQNVRVSIELKPLSAAKEIADVPVVVEGTAHKNWTISPSVVTVTIEGMPSKINSPDVASLDITAFVNAENLFTKQTTLPVRARIGSDSFKIIKIDPATVTITNTGE